MSDEKEKPPHLMGHVTPLTYAGAIFPPSFTGSPKDWLKLGQAKADIAKARSDAARTFAENESRRLIGPDLKYRIGREHRVQLRAEIVELAMQMYRRGCADSK